MRGRLLLFVLLASALTFLASLYLPWQVAPRACNPTGTDCFSGTSSNAWSSGLGDAAAVIGVALAAATTAGLVRRRLAGHLPLEAGGLLAAYLGIAAAALFRARIAGFAPFDHHVQFDWSYGAYLGVASGIVAAVVAAVIRGRALLPKRGIEALASALGLALLVSFLLPWHEIPLRQGVFNDLGILSPAAILAAVLVALGSAASAIGSGWDWRSRSSAPHSSPGVRNCEARSGSGRTPFWGAQPASSSPRCSCVGKAPACHTASSPELAAVSLRTDGRFRGQRQRRLLPLRSWSS